MPQKGPKKLGSPRGECKSDIVDGPTAARESRGGDLLHWIHATIIEQAVCL